MTANQSARQVLQAVRQRYLTLTRYADSGQVWSRTKEGDYVCTFRSDVILGGDFRFSFECPHPYRPLRHKVRYYEVGRTGGQGFFATCTPQGVRSTETLEAVEVSIARATGISSGAAYTLGGLLVEEVGGCVFSEWRRPRLRAYRVVNGVVCICITGYHPRAGRMTLYVGREDLLVRRLVDHRAKSQEDRYVTDFSD